MVGQVKNPAFEATVRRNVKGEFDFKDKNGKPVAGEEAPVYDMGEDTKPLRTLITARVPLATERHGKVPTVVVGDNGSKIQKKLATYIEHNFDGDKEEETLNALHALYGENVEQVKDPSEYEFEGCEKGWNSCHRKEASEQQIEQIRNRLREQVTGERRYMSSKLGEEPRMYWDKDSGTFFYVSDVKHCAANMKCGYYFNGTRVSLNETNFGSLEAANVIVSNMDASDLTNKERTRLLEDMQSNKPKSYKSPYMDQAISGVYGAINAGLFPADTTEDSLIKAVAYYADHGQNGLSELASGRLEQTEKKLSQPDLDVEERAKLLRDKRNLEYTIKACRYGEISDRYLKAVGEVLDVEKNSELNRSRSDSMKKHTATVFMDKKHQDPQHVQAGKESSFAKKFGHIEVDDSVDLNKFQQVSKEFESYSNSLPAQKVKADMRFRMTGRHHATGVYHPGYRNIAVDPRSPSSFTHEYFHHLDHTSGQGDLSLDPEFRSIVKKYQTNLDGTKIKGTSPDNYLAPTEIFARAGELWMQKRVGHDKTTFLKSKESYDTQFDYQPFKDMESEVFAFFDKHFGDK